MEKRVYICDCCGKEFPKMVQANLRRFPKNPAGCIDICTQCQSRITYLVVSGKQPLLRPYCKKCLGTGLVEHKEDQGDHFTRCQVACLECNLWQQ